LEKSKWIVKCRCGVEFDLRTAPWCGHNARESAQQTKMCPNGHCICHLLGDMTKFRLANDEEREAGFSVMLKEEYGGVKGIKQI